MIAKASVAGRVKTRLCPPCTPGQAADIAEAALADTLDEILEVGSSKRGVDVLGLAMDGGYWAIGLSCVDDEFLAAAFIDVPMSTSRTGVYQLRRLHQLGRSVHMLESTRDLDMVEDLLAAARAQRPGRFGRVVSAVAARLI